MKCLLRTYDGVYDNRVSVHERQVAKLTRKKVEEVKDALFQLHTLGVIEYLPQKETPQIYFILNRAPAQFLHINHENYLQRKQQFELRTAAMLHYLHLQKDCRSKYVSDYFGDTMVKECGICDICLHKKGTSLSEEEFRKIEQRICYYIDKKALPVKDLLASFNGIKKEKIWKVLEFLQGEQKITIDEFGIIKLN